MRRLPGMFAGLRQIWLIALVVLPVWGSALSARAMEPYDGKLAFDVVRGDKTIGKHEITFREIGDETHVDIDIELAVKIGFVTVIR
ncbi:MAG: hypothetical protein HQ495_05355, partial [Alphaproteobacteria bacterium]|nr:hypothetical protein [Alphaproteobacteria bacterium]